jgi:trimethylamine--corrinoid protein Co-methyltransferase
VIDAVGPDGEFLTSDHTLRHVRDPWYPRLFDRHNHEEWLDGGRQTLRERAAARVDEILASHQPDPLPEAARQAVSDIVARAARQSA